LPLGADDCISAVLVAGMFRSAVATPCGRRAKACAWRYSGAHRNPGHPSARCCLRTVGGPSGGKQLIYTADQTGLPQGQPRKDAQPLPPEDSCGRGNGRTKSTSADIGGTGNPSTVPGVASKCPTPSRKIWPRPGKAWTRVNCQQGSSYVPAKHPCGTVHFERLSAKTAAHIARSAFRPECSG
jgi:hypothetical protein